MSVLLTGDEGTGTLAAVRALRRAGWSTWLAVSQPHTYAARSNAIEGVLEVPDPLGDPVGHARALAGEARRLGVAAVLPGTEGSLRALTGRESLFDGVRVGTAPAAALELATDKSSLPELARAAGLESPVTIRLETPGLPPGLRWPVLVKPTATVVTDGGHLVAREVRRVASQAELERAVDGGGEWLVQPYVEGLVGAVCGVAWEGRLVCASHQRSLRIWPVRNGIAAYAVTVERDAALEERIEELARLIGWSGVLQVQLIHATDGPYVIDVNPRIYGSLALAVAAGHNLPAIWLEHLQGHEPRVGPYRVGVRYRVEEDDFRAMLALRQWSGLRPRRDTVHGVFSLRDPAPSLESLRKVVRRAASA